VCGHDKALHWLYGRMEGCSPHAARTRRCRCGGYHPISRSLLHDLAELLDWVRSCERDWALMDRIDLALGESTRRDARSRGRSR
jgi:hypothetical protein